MTTYPEDNGNEPFCSLCGGLIAPGELAEPDDSGGICHESCRWGTR